MRHPASILGLLLAAIVPLAAGCRTGTDVDHQRFGVRYLEDEEFAFLVLINDYRTTNGLGALTSSATINQAAYDHSVDMGTRGFFSHPNPDGQTPWDRMCEAGYEPACSESTAMGENIAAGNADAFATFEQWRNSPPHNENMLSADYRAIGIGRAFVAGSDQGWYWTTDFGGIVDEDGCACAAGAAEACVTASCGAGRRTCNARCQWSGCDVPAAGTEICDGYDNDCDGEVDEGGLCGSCVPTDEVCDDRDNDCDGAADENRVCGPACEAAADAEACNGNDDDCDGVIDDGCPCPVPGAERPCGVDEGRCRSGVQTCRDGAWSACADALLPRAEICDGIDNDCDGTADERACGVAGSDDGGGCSVGGAGARPGAGTGGLLLAAVFAGAAARGRRGRRARRAGRKG